MKQHGKYCKFKWKNFNCGYTEYNYDKCVWTKTRKIKTMKITIWWGGVIEGPLFKIFFLVNLCCPVKTRSRAYEISPVCWVFWKSMLFSKVTKCKVKEGLACLYIDAFRSEVAWPCIFIKAFHMHLVRVMDYSLAKF